MKINKSILLLGVSVLSIILFFSITCYKQFLEERLLSAGPQLMIHIDHMSIEDRKLIRWELPYIFSQKVKQKLSGPELSESISLLPSTSFCQKNGWDMECPEPVVFYYFSGIKTVTATCSNTADAQYVVYPQRGQLQYGRILSKEALQYLIDQFQTN